MYGHDILCVISTGTFEIPHKYLTKTRFIYVVEKLRALRFKSSYMFLKRPQVPYIFGTALEVLNELCSTPICHIHLNKGLLGFVLTVTGRSLPIWSFWINRRHDVMIWRNNGASFSADVICKANLCTTFASWFTVSSNTDAITFESLRNIHVVFSTLDAIE